MQPQETHNATHTTTTTTTKNTRPQQQPRNEQAPQPIENNNINATKTTTSRTSNDKDANNDDTKTDNSNTTKVSSNATEKTTPSTPNKESTSKPAPTTSSSSSSPRFAYAFAISGCNPHQPSYRNYLYNVMIATKLLQLLGSQADVVVMIQMDFYSPQQPIESSEKIRLQKYHSEHGNGRVNGTLPDELKTRLPPQDETMLQALGIRIKYIPPHPQQSFYRSMLDKFRVWSLVEYDRVLFLDGDIVPIANLDYLLHASYQSSVSNDGDKIENLPVLQENVVVQGNVGPYNGGFWMTQPNWTHYEQLHDIIVQREAESRNIPKNFNTTKGWGHVLGGTLPDGTIDQWTGNKSNGTEWNFNGAHTDQGLLFYWMRYIRKRVSVIRDEDGIVENWDFQSIKDTAHDPEAPMMLQETFVQPFRNVTAQQLTAKECPCRVGKYPPANGYVHLTGHNKPWLKGPPKSKDRFDCRKFWYDQLRALDKELNLGVDFTPRQDDDNEEDTKDKKKETDDQNPTLGFFAAFTSAALADSNILEPMYD